MSRELIVKCDLCGVAKGELPMHWSSSIEKLNLKFQHYSSIQQDIKVDDCCMRCASHIKKGIHRIINDIKEGI